MKIKIISIIILVFFLGLFTGKFFLPTIKTVTKEVKIYDFSQELKVMEIYANTTGKTFKDLSIYEKEKEAILDEIKKLRLEELRVKVEQEKLKRELRRLR